MTSWFIEPDTIRDVSFNNKEILSSGGNVSCYGCCTNWVFEKDKTEFTKDDTAICPHCSIDSVIPFKVPEEHLIKLRDHFFKPVKKLGHKKGSLSDHEFLHPGRLVRFNGEWQWAPLDDNDKSYIDVSYSYHSTKDDKIFRKENLTGTVVFSKKSSDDKNSIIVGVFVPELKNEQKHMLKTVVDLNLYKQFPQMIEVIS